MTVAPNEAGGVKNCIQFRDNLYMLKSQRTYSTSRDFTYSDSALFWRIISVDEGVGTECFGIATVLDTAGPNTDVYIAIARTGLFTFNGMYLQPEFSWKIDRYWGDLDQSNFDKMQVVNDVVGSRIYILLPDGTLLVANYQNGLAYSNIRWAHWTFPWPITCIGIDIDSDNRTNVLLGANSVVWKLNIEYRFDDMNDGDYGINTIVEYAPQTIPNYGSISHFHNVRMRAVGEGSLLVTVKGIDGASPMVLRPLSLSAIPGKYLSRLCNLRNEKCTVRLELENAGEWIDLIELSLFASELWQERPSDTT
jgi:hypothetical protein